MQVELPLVYRDPFDEKVYWFCDLDKDKKITSVFLRDKDKRCFYLADEASILEQQKMLVDAGWIKCKLPSVEITYR